MGQRYLLDTNIVIYYLEGLLDTSNKLNVKSIVEKGVHISVVSKIELLGWNPPYGSRIEKLNALIHSSIIYGLTDSVADATIAIRKAYKKIKLPDAIIAATCIHYNFTLISRNLSDFSVIRELTTINPFDL